MAGFIPAFKQQYGMTGQSNDQTYEPINKSY